VLRRGNNLFFLAFNCMGIWRYSLDGVFWEWRGNGQGRCFATEHHLPRKLPITTPVLDLAQVDNRFDVNLAILPPREFRTYGISLVAALTECRSNPVITLAAIEPWTLRAVEA
jgi:hypothetical protein